MSFLSVKNGIFKKKKVQRKQSKSLTHVIVVDSAFSSMFLNNLHALLNHTTSHLTSNTYAKQHHQAQILVGSLIFRCL